METFRFLTICGQTLQYASMNVNKCLLNIRGYVFSGRHLSPSNLLQLAGHEKLHSSDCRKQLFMQRSFLEDAVHHCIFSVSHFQSRDCNPSTYLHDKTNPPGNERTHTHYSKSDILYDWLGESSEYCRLKDLPAPANST